MKSSDENPRENQPAERLNGTSSDYHDTEIAPPKVEVMSTQADARVSCKQASLRDKGKRFHWQC